MNQLDHQLAASGSHKLSGVPEGFDALLLAEAEAPDLLFIARDDARLAHLEEALRYFAPELDVLSFPAWDTVPYDRVSPHVDIVALRIDTLTKLLGKKGPRRRITLATVSGVLQRVPPRSFFVNSSLAAGVGTRLAPEKLIIFLSGHGYVRSETVMEPGEFAVRGGIIDLFPPGREDPLRLDWFGDEIEAIRSFDPMTQISAGRLDGFILQPMGEALLDEASITRFRGAYRELFGAVSRDDQLYESISAGRRFGGMEHWLPLFHAKMETIFDYLPDAAVIIDYQGTESLQARLDLIAEYYQSRKELAGKEHSDSGIYNPLPPGLLHLDAKEWEAQIERRAHLSLSPFAAPDGSDLGGRQGKDFVEVRATPGGNVFEAFKEHTAAEHKSGRRVALATCSEGSRERLRGALRDHGMNIQPVASWAEFRQLSPGSAAAILLDLDHGFVAPGLAVVAEADLLGDRLARPPKKKRRSADKIISEASALSEGDLVVHVDHGIGRYDGLETLQVSGAPHDCLRLTYDGGDKLYLPVENIDLLSRFGSEQAGVSLDKLGGVAWQARKAKLKKRIRDMAEQLIAIAAQRLLRRADALLPAEGLYDEFCARFPYAETDDQTKAIADVTEDLASGKPMDRLICGDVGFGKTEVALRAAFMSALSGGQVAVVVPTTLLCRQHFRNFVQRFAGLPVQVEQLSRMVTGKQAEKVRQGLAEGTVDIVIGTHALLAKNISFKYLKLLVIDEEQHFGVAHKERLKQLRSDVHVLTLTATPIPRTLQMALAGVREMSIIATPPVDRLAVRTFVLPFDQVVIREALLREHYRGGQSFYVTPRIEDIDKLAEKLRELVPELRLAVAHGRLSPTAIEEVMTAFGDRAFDILLSTTIIESGIDMPQVNTLIIHRADMFGLSQLYQLRGRVGRSKQRAYAYLTVPPGRLLTKGAEKRLEVMQTLDSLGAGFTLASHDLDIRGAGNLLGDEQSGHIREVGVELYQQLLEEAVAAAKGDGGESVEQWSPQIALGAPVLIPESYVSDLAVRLGLYRRIADLADIPSIEAMAAELIDRFGKLPQEVENLLEIVAVKVSCRVANIEKIDAGPKGAVIALRNNSFPNPPALIQYISRQVGTVKVRPDQKLVIVRGWEVVETRVKGIKRLAAELAEMALGGN